MLLRCACLVGLCWGLLGSLDCMCCWRHRKPPARQRLKARACCCGCSFSAAGRVPWFRAAKPPAGQQDGLHRWPRQPMRSSPYLSYWVPLPLCPEDEGISDAITDRWLRLFLGHALLCWPSFHTAFPCKPPLCPQEEGFSDAIIDRFFRPFLGGIFFDRQLGTTSRLFAFVMRMLATGGWGVENKRELLGWTWVAINIAADLACSLTLPGSTPLSHVLILSPSAGRCGTLTPHPPPAYPCNPHCRPELPAGGRHRCCV